MRVECNSNWFFWKKGSLEKKKVTIPHDAMLHEERSPEAGAGSASGFFPGGVYYYEKVLHITKEQLESSITLEFEGVYKNAEVYVNGELAYKAAYGYIPFFVPVNEWLKEGDNVLLVKADNEKQPDSRWYSGAGIYRPVWLHIQPKEHIVLEGIRIRTISISPATIEIDVERTSGTVKIDILDMKGNIVASGKDNTVIELSGATLWSEDTPYLYTAKVTLMSDTGEELEIVEETFGVRQVTWSPEGFFVNGKNTLLRGGCIHHDNGILGACTYDESEDRKIRILKDGFNAIRASHNPCSKSVLRACDKYGVYVMDESWDMWYSHKNKYDYATEFMEHYLDDLRAMVRRDYNHPSVVMYSIGNEVSEPATEKGVALAKKMVDYVRSLDDTRAVTGGFNLMIIKNSAAGKGIYKEEGGREDNNDQKMAGMNSTMFNFITSLVGSGMNKAANGKKADEATSPVLATLDICGYNYASGRYMGDGKLHPERIIVGSETFPQDIAKNWDMVKKLPYLIGDFMWTAWDYIGEAGLGTWIYELSRLQNFERETIDCFIRQKINEISKSMTSQADDIFTCLPEHFLDKDVDVSQTEKNEKNVFIDSIRGRRIEFDTIHGVKGETHDATLYLETDRQGASDLNRILPYYGVGKLGKSNLFDYSRKLAYDIVNIGLHFFLKNVRPYAASCNEA